MLLPQISHYKREDYAPVVFVVESRKESPFKCLLLQELDDGTYAF